MMRQLLILSTRPLDEEILLILQRSSWSINWAADAREARRQMETDEPLVGLFVLWPGDSARHTTGVIETVRATRRMRWIGGLDRERLSGSAYLALAAEHLHDFVSLPLDGERLAVIVGHAYGMAELDRLYLAGQEGDAQGQLGMLGTSPAMRDLYDAIRQAAASDAPVLLTGEIGTGKETAARAIHAASARANRPFVTINCASLPAHPNSGLIGLLPGGDPGWFEIDQGFAPQNEGGTLFLDGIPDLPRGAQARLLQLIDGAGAATANAPPWEGAPVRIVSAGDVDILPLVRDGRFRADLFYRLQVLSIQVPSLRERGDDIQALAIHFLQQFQQTHPTQAEGFNRDALAVLACHDWPGNLRELRNRVHQAALYCDRPYITPSDLHLERRSDNRVCLTLQEVREEAERQAVESAVRRNQLNMTRAAEELAISRMTLYRLLHKHGIEVER
jgi:DNA-binding NtrC family response regulator